MSVPLPCISALSSELQHHETEETSESALEEDGESPLDEKFVPEGNETFFCQVLSNGFSFCKCCETYSVLREQKTGDVFPPLLLADEGNSSLGIPASLLNKTLWAGM